MARKLRPALEIVSDIGSLGFDLQHHDPVQIAAAVALIRTVNPEMIEWLARVLTEEAATRPAKKETEEAPTCRFHGTMVADDEMGSSGSGE